MLRAERWDPGAIGYLVKGIEKAVRKSFVLEPILRLDKDKETRRRILLSVDIYRIMAHDLKWGARRAADRLEVYLMKKIRGEVLDFSLERAAGWIGPGTLEGGANDPGTNHEVERSGGDPEGHLGAPGGA